MALHNSIDRMLASIGEPYTIRREARLPGVNSWTDGALTVSYIPTRGKERYEVTKIIEGGIQEGDKLCVLGSKVEPMIDDKVAPGVHTSDEGVTWRQVINPEAVRAQGRIAGYRVIMRM